MAYSKVFVAGGAKGVGRQIVEQLSAKGTQVVAIVRREDAKAELEQIPGVTAIMADAFDLKAVEGAIDGCDAAITTLGGTPSTPDGARVDYEGNRNVIESAGILGVTRVILVTSVGCGDSRGAISDQTFAVLEKPILAKNKAESMLQKYYTNSEWTIVRPGGLASGPATGKAIFTEDKKSAGVINRADVAALIVQALDSKKTFQKVLTAVDPSIESSFGNAQDAPKFEL